MIRRPPRSTRTYPLFPYTTLVRSGSARLAKPWAAGLMFVRQQEGGNRRKFGLPIGLAEGDARQGSLRAQQQGLGYGRAPVTDVAQAPDIMIDRKSTRLNSSH